MRRKVVRHQLLRRVTDLKIMCVGYVDDLVALAMEVLALAQQRVISYISPGGALLTCEEFPSSEMTFNGAMTSNF